jgi:transcription antitermination factor NusG
MTRPNTERVVAASLEQSRLAVFLPLVAEPTSKGIRKVSPLFRNYLFLWLSQGLTEVGEVKRTKHVRGFLGASECPVPVRAGVVERLLERQETMGVAVDLMPAGAPDVAYAAGDAVRIMSGPLSGHDATVIEARGHRLKLLAYLFGSKVEVKASVLQVSPVEYALSA